MRRTEFADQWKLGDGDDTLTLDGHPHDPEGPSIVDGSGNDVVRGSQVGDSIFDGSGRNRHCGLAVADRRELVIGRRRMRRG